MFTTTQPSTNDSSKKDPETKLSKYKNIVNTNVNISETNETNYNEIEKMLDREKQQNKTETWNKLDKTIKIQKLHEFAERYGKEHAFPVKDIKSLKTFFIECLEKNKLQKTKEVVYDKETRTLTSIPALHFNVATNKFTLKVVDTKRVSTLKSLTPKRSLSQNQLVIVENE
jgi:hypothetical protein